MPPRSQLRLALASVVVAWLAVPPARADDLSIRVLEPDRGDLLAGATVLRAEVTLPPGTMLQVVQFLVDGSPLAVDREPQYEALWTGIDPVRDHLIRVTAVTTDGRRTYGLHSVPMLGLIERVSVTGRSPDFVLFDITFLDQDGRPVVDIRREELIVLEDGKQQIIDVFAPDDRPLASLLLLDASQSTRARWSELGSSTRLFAETLRAEDRAGVVAFNNRLVELAPLGSGASTIESATASFMDWGGTTRLYDAMSNGSLLDLGQEESRRRALVVLTDAFDFGSTLEVQDVGDYLRRSEVEMHAALLFTDEEIFQLHGAGGGQMMADRRGLVQLARLTGGSAYQTGSIPMPEIFLQIGERLRAQYLLGYNSISPRPPGKPRRIEVQLRREGEWNIRYRRTHYGSQNLAQYLALEMSHGPERRRRQAVRTAARMSDPVALSAVVLALGQGKGMRAGVGREARFALLERGFDVIPYLKKAVEDGDPDASPRAAEVLIDLFVRLARSDRIDAMEEALTLLGDGNATAGRAALERLERSGISGPTQERLDEVLDALER